MKIAVIAATGRTGKLVVEQGIRRGHEITAMTRHPEQLQGITGIKSIVKGDATNPDETYKALVGQDAVICAVGTSAIVRNLAVVMPKAGLKRVVMTSSRSITGTRPKLLISIVWFVFHDAYADLARAEGMLEISGLDWSVVRATMLNDKPYSGKVHIDYQANATGGDWQLSRADYAMTLLDVAENNDMIHKAPGVCGIKNGEQNKSAA